MFPTFEFTPEFPIQPGIWTVPPRGMSGFLSGEDIVSILYCAESLVSYSVWKI